MTKPGALYRITSRGGFGLSVYTTEGAYITVEELRSSIFMFIEAVKENETDATKYWFLNKKGKKVYMHFLPIKLAQERIKEIEAK